MGSSADAAIVYGFPFKGEDFDFDSVRSAESYYDDPEKWLATFQGLTQPASESGDANDRAWSEYLNAQRALPIKTEFGGYYMEDDETTIYLCIREASLSGDWGGGTKIPVDHIRPPPFKWKLLLKAFCEKAGVPFQQPDWFLLVSYG